MLACPRHPPASTGAARAERDDAAGDPLGEPRAQGPIRRPYQRSIPLEEGLSALPVRIVPAHANTMSAHQHDPNIELNASQSWGLLRGAVVGRLAVISPDHTQPDIFPINYIVDRGSIVFRTSEGSKLAAARDSSVAFEADGYNPFTGEAWSVVVKGTAREVKKLHEVFDALNLPLFPWHATPKPRILRIEPDLITGRRFHAFESPIPACVRRAAVE